MFCVWPTPAPPMRWKVNPPELPQGTKQGKWSQREITTDSPSCCGCSSELTSLSWAVLSINEKAKQVPGDKRSSALVSVIRPCIAATPLPRHRAAFDCRRWRRCCSEGRRRSARRAGRRCTWWTSSPPMAGSTTEHASAATTAGEPSRWFHCSSLSFSSWMPSKYSSQSVRVGLCLHQKIRKYSTGNWLNHAWNYH